MIKIKLYDELSPGCNSFGNTKQPDNFEWYRGPDVCDIAVFTDSSLHMVEHAKEKIKIAWLIESPELYRKTYDYIISCYKRFNIVATFNKRIISRVPNSVMVYFGGCWIQNPHINKKTKLVSIVASGKKETSNQNLRHTIINKFKSVEAYGLGTDHPIPHLEKHIGLNDYMYGIVIENCCCNYYFTEKLIDSFATGRVPIYCGCADIGDIFDKQGIISFKSINDLDYILNDIVCENDYNSRMRAIKKNYEEAKKYYIPENELWDKVIRRYV